MSPLRIRHGVLRVRQHEPKTLTWWHEQFRQGRLDMAPEYQRRSDLWNKWKKAHLIDSILNDYDVPKFYVANFTSLHSGLNRRKLPYAVIDGKQRLEAIFDFLGDKLELNQTFVLESDPAQALAGLRFSALKAHHPTVASKFENFAPVVMSVVTDSAEKIQQMFIRLNSGEPANSAERRNAMPGPVPRVVRGLIMHPFFQDRISFNTKRMAEFNLAAKLLLIEVRGRFVDTKAKNLDQFVLEAAPSERVRARKHKGVVSAAVLHEAESKVIETLELLAKVFHERDPLLKAQSHIPVYYWLVRNKPGVVAKLRGFLESFTRELRDNLKLSRVDPDRADPVLSLYYTLGRTTNDEASLKRRYEIIVEKLG